MPAAAVKIVADKVVPDPLPPPAPAALGPVQPRRLYIRREVEIARYGGTEGFPGCLAAALNRTAVSHSAECRARFDMELEKVFGGAGRVIGARARRARPESGATMPQGTGDEETEAKRRRVEEGRGEVRTWRRTSSRSTRSWSLWWEQFEYGPASRKLG